MKIPKGKERKKLALVVILGIFGILNISVGVYDFLYLTSMVGIPGKIFGLSLVAMGVPLLLASYGIWKSKEKGYFLAMLVVLGDMIISSGLLWKLCQSTILLDIVIDLALMAGILHVKGEEEVKEEE